MESLDRYTSVGLLGAKMGIFGSLTIAIAEPLPTLIEARDHSGRGALSRTADLAWPSLHHNEAMSLDDQELTMKALIGILLSGVSFATAIAPTFAQSLQMAPSGNQTIRQPRMFGMQTTLDVNSLNGVLNATGFAGSDIGAQINSAYAACPETGCTIIVPPGSYTDATPVVIATKGKPAIIRCSGTGTTIAWKPNMGEMFQFAANGAGNGQGWGEGIRDCNLSSSQSEGSVAVQFGVTTGDTTGRTAQGSYLDNIQISGFGRQIDYESQAWNITLNHVELIDALNNAIWMNPSAEDAGENLNFIGVTVGNSQGRWMPQAVFLNSGMVVAQFVGSNFDNAQLSIPFGTVNCESCSFENPGPVVRTTSWIDIGIATSTMTGLTMNDVGVEGSAIQPAITVAGSFTLTGGIAFGAAPAGEVISLSRTGHAYVGGFTFPAVPLVKRQPPSLPHSSAVGNAGFTGTKTAGRCILTIQDGIITNVTGC